MHSFVIVVLLCLCTLILGAIHVGRYYEKSKKLKDLMRLPAYWMVYELSQDLVTGSWNLTVISIHEKDSNGTSLVVCYTEAFTVLEAFDGVRVRIATKDYFNVDGEVSI